MNILTKKAVATLTVFILLASVFISSSVLADPYQARIDALNKEISQNESKISNLSRQGDTLENKLTLLRSEISNVQAKIAKTQQEIKQLQWQLKETEAKLAEKKKILNENVRELYKRGEVSAIEVLASSDNFSDFVGRQEYLETVKASVQKAANEIVALKESLEAKKAEQDKLLATQKGQQNQLVARRAEQKSLLDKTRGEEARYQRVVSEQQSRLRQLEEQQRAAYAAAAAAARDNGQFVSTGGSGSYPWAGQPYPCWSGGCADPWGLYYRECVSYTAWKVANSGRYIRHFNGSGNANQWPAATSDYAAQGYSPRVGAVAIDMSIQPYGHAMYVEQVYGDGTILISEYNFAGPGQYSERRISQGGLTYIYF